MKEYKIIERIYYNKNGEAEAPVYYIQELKPLIPLFGFKMWSYVKETELGMGDYYKTPMEFPTIADAQNFIDDVLSKNKPKEKFKYTEIKRLTCND